MKKTLVNHGGVIQDKFIIKTIDELNEYHEVVNAKQHAYHALDFSEKPNKVRDYMINTAQRNQESIIVSAARLADNKYIAMLNRITEGYVLVVNMVGGWTFWNDRDMSIVDESERKDNDSEYSPKVNIGNNSVLILENQETIPNNVLEFVKDGLKQDSYSSVVRLNTDYNNEITRWISEALKNGCEIIVAETQLMDKNQITKLCKLFQSLPEMIFYIFSSVDLKDKLIDVIGEEETNKLYEKHVILNNPCNPNFNPL